MVETRRKSLKPAAKGEVANGSSSEAVANGNSSAAAAGSSAAPPSNSVFTLWNLFYASVHICLIAILVGVIVQSADTRQELTSATAELSSVKTKLDKVTKENNILRDSNKDKEGEWREKVKELKIFITNQDVEIKLLKDDIVKLKDDIGQKEVLFTDTEARNTELIDQISAAADANTIKDQLNDHKETIINELTKNTDELTATLKEVSEKLSKQESEAEALILKAAELEKENEALSLKAPELVAENEALNQKASELVAENEALNLKSSELVAENAALILKASEIVAENENLNLKSSELVAENEAMNLKASELVTELEALQEKTADLENGLQGVISSMDLTKEAFKECEEKGLKIMEDMQQLETSSETLSTNLAAATADLHVEREKSADLETKLVSSEAEKSLLKLESTDQLNALRGEVADLQGAKDLCETESSLSLEKAAQLETSVDKINKLLEEKVAELQEVEQAKEDLNKRTSELQGLSEQLAAEQQKLSACTETALSCSEQAATCQEREAAYQQQEAACKKHAAAYDEMEAATIKQLEAYTEKVALCETRSQLLQEKADLVDAANAKVKELSEKCKV